MSFAAQLDLLCCHSPATDATSCVGREDEIRGTELNDSASANCSNRATTSEESSTNDDSNERFAGDCHAFRSQQLLPFAALLSANDAGDQYVAHRSWHDAMFNGQNVLASQAGTLHCPNGHNANSSAGTTFDQGVIHRRETENANIGKIHGFMNLRCPTDGMQSQPMMGCLSDPCLGLYETEDSNRHHMNGRRDSATFGQALDLPPRRKRCAQTQRTTITQCDYSNKPSQRLPAIYSGERVEWNQSMENGRAMRSLFSGEEGIAGMPGRTAKPESWPEAQTMANTVWPCGSMKLAQVMSDLQAQQRGVVMSSCDEVDLQLPRSVINKLVRDAAGRIRVSAEAREVIINCCHEFVRVLGALANLSCEENKKKLIGPDHIIAALTEMGMQSFCASCLDIMNTIQEEAAQKRKRVTLCYDGDGSTVDRLLKEQQELFQQARKEQCLLEDAGDSSDESLKDGEGGRTVVIHGVKHQLPAFRPMASHETEYKEDDDYD